MEQNKINYNEVIELGFERQDMNDEVFFRKNGFQWFLVELKLTKHIYAKWDCEEKTVELIRHNKEADILARLPVLNLDELKMWVDFFKS